MKGKRLYPVNNEVFDYWSPAMAYALGFIAADGSVWKYTLSIHLQAKDEPVLNFFCDLISPTSPIKTVVKKGRQYVRLRVNSVTLMKSLSSYGIIPNKTPSIKVDFTIPDEYLGAYLRGLFDGDGWVCNRRNIVEAGICSGAAGFLDYFCSRTGLGKVRRRKKKVSFLWCWEFNYADSMKLRDMMYSDGGFALARKKERFYITRQPRSSRFWRDEDVQFLLKNYRAKTRGNLAILSCGLGKSRKAVSKKIWEMGLVSRTAC